MYSDLWSPTLRQGDIVGPLHVPSVRKDLQIVTAAAGGVATSSGGSHAVKQALVDVKQAHVAVMSHDCEFNDGKRNRFLVAVLQSIPGNLTSERIDELVSSNNIEPILRSGGTVAGADSFVVDPVPGAFSERRVISFTQIFSWPMGAADDLQRCKRAEMLHEVRLLLRHKFSWFFLRGTEDIPADEKMLPEDVLGGLAPRF